MFSRRKAARPAPAPPEGSKSSGATSAQIASRPDAGAEGSAAYRPLLAKAKGRAAHGKDTAAAPSSPGDAGRTSVRHRHPSPDAEGEPKMALPRRRRTVSLEVGESHLQEKLGHLPLPGGYPRDEDLLTARSGLEGLDDTEGTEDIAYIIEMRARGQSASAMRHLGASASALRAAGFTARQLRAAAFTEGQLEDASFSAEAIRLAGYRTESWAYGGYTWTSLCAEADDIYIRVSKARTSNTGDDAVDLEGEEEDSGSFGPACGAEGPGFHEWAVLLEDASGGGQGRRMSLDLSSQ